MGDRDVHVLAVFDDSRRVKVFQANSNDFGNTVVRITEVYTQLGRALDEECA
jgi:hypothetical protein